MIVIVIFGLMVRVVVAVVTAGRVVVVFFIPGMLQPAGRAASH